jgi:adenylate cyclase
MIKLNLRNKILLVMTLLVLFIMIAVLVILNETVTNQTIELIKQDFRKTRLTFERFQQLRNDRLLESCVLISEQPQFKANLDLALRKLDEQSHQTVLFNLGEFENVVVSDLFIVTDRKGTLIARTDIKERFGDDLSGMPSIKSLLAQEEPVTILVQENKLYQIATVPILLGDELLGTLTLGLQITDDTAKELKKDTQSEITFFLENDIMASSLSPESRVDLQKSYFSYSKEIMDMMGSDTSSYIKEVKLKDERFLSTFAPIVKGGKEIYAIAVSLDKALEPLTTIQIIIIVLGVAGIIIAFLISVIVSKGISAPVLKLVDATHKIGQGDYNFQIEVKSKDEIGTLANSFNEMITGLRERFNLLKFVSSSTADLVKKAGAGGVKLGGERKSVTVFFSDIRGFTAFSEKAEPEMVVEMLNRYLRKEAEIVKKYNGDIDKYVGDELVAVFRGDDMVDNAVLCAIEIQKEINKLNEANAQDMQDIKIGIGINSGVVVMGAMGSEERMDYTVLGSNVNLGARLCSSAGAGQILLAEASKALLKAKVQTKKLEPINVKGISAPVQIYEVIY